MNPQRLNIDDMTRATITIGHGPNGWIVDMSALGHGSAHVLGEAISADDVRKNVGDFIAGYLDRMTAILADARGGVE
jgi:hypothetical protein